MLDPKLIKLLNKKAKAETTGGVEAEFISELSQRIENGENCLALITPSLEKQQTVSAIMNRLSTHRKIWYIAPERTLSMYRLLRMRSSLENQTVSTFTRLRQDPQSGARISIWSVELLAEELPGWRETPEAAIVDETEFLEIPAIGSAIQEVLALLPQTTATVVIASPYSNADKLAQTLGKIRGAPFHSISLNMPKPSSIPAFLTSDWQLIPLVDNRRVANRVKRLIKETEPFKSYRSGKFINRLIALLREGEFTPALILCEKQAFCEAAVAECHKSAGTAGRILTEPQIVSLLERNPALKEDPRLNDSLSKKAAAFHSEQHPLWQELVEHFLAYNAIDIVFSPAQDAGDLMTAMRSVVILESGGDPADHITTLEMDRIKRLVGSSATDSTGLIILAHTPESEPAYIKDLLISPPGSLLPPFNCTPGSVLRLLLTSQAETTWEEKCLACGIRENWGEFCLEALQHGLREELEKARCVVHIKTVIKLIDLRLKLTKDISRLEYEVSEARGAADRSKLIEELAEYRYSLSLLPCEACPHITICHKRGSKKFRTLLSTFETSLDLLYKANAGLRLEISLIIESLKEFGMIDYNGEPTRFGQLALRTGMDFPHFLSDALKSGAINPDQDDDISLALIAGFLDPLMPEKQPLPKAFAESAGMLASLSQNFRPAISLIRERLLLFGLDQKGFYINNAVLALECQKTPYPEVVAQQCGVSAGQSLRFLSQVQTLRQRLKNQKYVDVSLY